MGKIMRNGINYSGTGGGGSTTTDYPSLLNKPKINGITLVGNKTSTDLFLLGSGLKGTANGLAELDSNGKVPASQIPGAVDEIKEGYLHDGKFYADDLYTEEIPGEADKIYVDLATNKTYRWGGSVFVEISESLALGETSSTAYAGNKGKKNADDIATLTQQIAQIEEEYSNVTPTLVSGVKIGTVKTNGTSVDLFAPQGSGGHTILSTVGAPMPQRSKLQFENCSISDDALNDTTVISVEGGGTTIVQIPSVVVGTYTYDGTEQAPTITGLDTLHTVITGTASATNAGSYSFTIALKDKSKMVWTDLTTADRSYEWSIGKAAGSVTLSANSVTLDEDHTSRTVTVSNATGAISVSSSDTSVATAVFAIDTITISSVNDTSGSATVTVDVDTSTNYLATSASISVSASFFMVDLQEWLTAGNVSGTYANFAAVEADEEAVRKLMTIHNAVDYLARCNSADDELALDIINSDICAKWINLRDYALDTLYANTYLATMMDTADKYFYGEWALVGQVSAMCSNTAPYGEASSSSQFSDYYAAWKVFDRNREANNYWSSATGQVTNQWIAYRFENPINIKKVSISNHPSTDAWQRSVKRFYVQSSNDGTSWNNETEVLTNPAANVTTSPTMFDVDSNTVATYWRIYIVDNYGNSSEINIDSIQFYAWALKGNVPVMTSNTDPYGEVVGSTTESSYDAWKAFDESYQSRFNGKNSDEHNYVGYKFVNPICVKKVRIDACGANNLSTVNAWYVGQFKIQASNDGNTWSDLYSGTFEDDYGHILSAAPDYGRMTIDINNDDYYLYYRVYSLNNAVISGSVDVFSIWELQFYGRELKGLIPIMTSNTTPSGVASAVSSNSTQVPYHAFDGIWSNLALWQASNSNKDSSWLQYKFDEAICVKNIVFKPYESQRIKAMQIKGSNDGTNWIDLYSETNMNYSGEITFMYNLDNNDDYMYYRFNFSSSTDTVCVEGIQFYNPDIMDYSEYDWDSTKPRKYIYDHGVELETITGGTKGNDAITLSSVSTATATVDTTNYTAMGGRVGMHASGTNALKCGSASSNFTAGNMPGGNGIDITNVNGSNATGVAQTASGIFDIEEVWIA